MSIRRNHYLREAVPYSRSSQSYGYNSTTTRNNASHILSTLVSSELDEEADEDFTSTTSTANLDKDIMYPTRTSNRSRSYELETETDVSVEDLRFSTTPSQPQLSSRDVENRQLGYFSHPGHLQLPHGLSTNSAVISESSRANRKSTSVESVAMDLDETDSIFLPDDDDIPTEDVDDETESTDDFVNMRVKVERKPYPTKAVKVTVSVQPPSEVGEDEEDDDGLMYRQFDAELLSVTSAEEAVSSESEIYSESQLSSSEEEDESEGDEEGESVDEEFEEEEESVCSSSQDDGGESEGESNNSVSESRVESKHFANDTKTVTAKSPAILVEEREQKTDNNGVEEEVVESAQETKDSTEKMLGLLDDAIDNSEKVKVKIIENATLAQIQQAEAIAIEEGEKLAAQIAGKGATSASSSPMVKVKGLIGGSVASAGVSQEAVKDKITAIGDEGKDLIEKVKSETTEAKKGLEESIAKAEKSVTDAVAVGSDNAKAQVKDIDKRIHHEASTIVNDITKSGETALSEMKLPTPLSSALSIGQNLTNEVIPPPPPNSIVVANVMVHETPKSSQSPPLLPKSSTSVTLPPISTATTAVSNVITIPTASTSTSTTTTKTTDINVKPKSDQALIPPPPSTIIQTSTIQQPPLVALTTVSQIPVPENSPSKSNDSNKFPEKDEFLSVCAADSLDSSEDDDEDVILRKQKTMAETEEERRDVEIAKDKLMEDWKSTRRGSIDELDDKFQHILEDMISEFSMEPVIPILPRKLKEAVSAVTDEEGGGGGGSTKSNSATSSIERSSESVREQTIEEEEEEEEDASFDEGGSPVHKPFQSSSSNEIPSKQNSLDSNQQSRNNSGRSNDSRKMTSSSKSMHSPAKFGPSSPMINTKTGGGSSSPKGLISKDSKSVSGQSPKSKLGSPYQIKRTPSAKSLKVQDSVDRPMSRPVSSNSRKTPTPTKTSSTKSLKTMNNQAPTPSKIPVSINNPAMNPSRISRSPTIKSTSKENIILVNQLPEAALKPNSVEGEDMIKSPMTNASKPASNPSLNNSSPKNNPSANSSQKMLSPHSPPIESSNKAAVDKSDNISSPSKSVSKSPSISRHSSLQTDQSMEETNWNLGHEDNNDLPNFNSNPEGGSDTEERDEDSPSQRRKWKNSTEIASTLSHYLHLIKTETVENSITEIIPLLTQLLVISRKNKGEHGLPTMIASLSAVRVLCERMVHVKILSGEKALKNVDLSWLIRILCKLSADPESKLKPEASFTLAKLVKAAGPELITRPIYFLLVMENEGYGHKRGSQGSKTKAAALDTLTYALLSFPKEDFDDLEEIARWVCLVVMHPHRRVRQAALECISVLGNSIGSPDAAVSRIRGYIIQESEQTYNRSDSDGSNVGTKSAIKTFDGKGIFDVSAITAISARIRKRILPLPSPYGLIEYGVKVPTGQELVLILTRMQEEEEEEYEGSTSEDSLHSSVGGDHHHHRHSDGDSESESIKMSDLEKSSKEEKVFGKKSKGAGGVKGEGAEEDDDDDDDVGELITPDVAYILSGKGRVNKQEIVNLNDENINNDNNDGKPNDKEKRKKALLRKKRQKKRQVERTYSEYEDDSPAED